ncbi:MULTISPECIES: acetyl-CoA carboxylase biotin carboxylase subunit [Xanthomarina]|jgi:acetyl-CoA carboxylase biotin carboxylase subunit|uniref:Biotin carboxylase n=1 Tax=Xanthomarina gelatinilytica TaxID=1137281 RepID=M7N2C6_9FLAO|nr:MULTISPECIES: acetyl-CoA carboxylase biotin carboxylase subunit [Xanthomarina]EMQ95889.1 Biotin carboxylase of acetyl-CoA carboxylase [Xanthomarina gelatinilytica]MAL22427.1 acetyl-CoA carboxylase biotin carboxylase subunit [Xanthomarina sp.]MBF60902.1 acetyl-CoA carboxylase biotin carboxylase subunit [Xanthomarina sp.]MDX1316027.1 acetyl-CoA carboxylase biotin carboxylase subunit [Xanthomarina gelatinilytica]HCY83108.1 acetyl-CoA carboxylase biotin carboxylase subunit [Xanthomarina gelatin|tara:strand:- start:285 stop:1637 length:1353 start_codon:yes stop_codon:yes gene_type:complete
MFKKILVANRGEIALRVIRTCKEMGIKTVAIYSTADAESLPVKFADEAVCIGPPPSNLSYLKMSNVIAAAEITNADAIHPGYGFLSENAKFSKICEEHKIKFIGASAEMINKMGDKASAKATMKAAGVPCVPGSDGIIEDFKEAEKIAKEIGYPVMLKATAGGGGKGMRAVWKPEKLKEAWESARQESKAAFGNDDMYMEKLIEEPRHIEIQIVGDSNGKACHLSERDCSVQRRHQKLTEEVPSPFMTAALRKKMGDAAVKAAEFIKYEGAGTVEFLVDKHRNFYFMEMNTRIQVEHPITEQVIDFDLIREQILVAAGVPISGKNYTPNLHSIECRINAEDPFNDFRPSPGKITTLHAPGGHGVRLDTHVYAGYTIPPNYDSMIAKLITTAQTREEAINKMKRALDEFVIEGVKTTIPFHRQLMEHPDYLAGNYTTKFMEDFVMQKPTED